MDADVRASIKAMQKVELPWRLEDTGFMRVDCFNAMGKVLQREFHFVPSVRTVDGLFVISVNGFEVCTKTLEQVRVFSQTVNTESYSFYQLVEMINDPGTNELDFALGFEVLLNYCLNDPFQHTGVLGDFLDSHYFSLFKSMEIAIRDGVLSTVDF